MSSLYYPYFQLDSTNDVRNYNHKLYLNTLLLFCTDMVIPARCVLTMGHDKFSALMKYKKFFRNGAICFRLPYGIKDLEGYGKKISGDYSTRQREKIKSRVKEINALNLQEIKQYDPERQQRYFAEKIYDFSKAYCRGHNIKNKYLLMQISKDADNKEKYDLKLEELALQNEITQPSFICFKSASSILYFIAGADQGNLKICDGFGMDDEATTASLRSIITNYDEIVNCSYNPEKILEKLQEIGVIQDHSDILKLDYDDIVELRSMSCFKKFVKKFCKLSNRNRALDYIVSKGKSFSYMKGLREFVVGLIIMVITTGISHIFSQSFLLDIGVGLLFALLSILITYLLDKFVIKIKWLDSFIEKIIGLIDSDYLYLYKIKQIIQKNNS